MIQSGDYVEKDQIIGTITDPFGEFKEPVHSAATGYVVGLNNNPVVNAGDALLHIGVDNMCKISSTSED
jgi:predicted deacylase